MSDATNPPSPPRRRLDWRLALVIAVAVVVVGGIIAAFVVYPQQAAEEAIGKPRERISENFEGPIEQESRPENGQ